MMRWERGTIRGKRGSGLAGAGRSLLVVLLLLVFLGTFWTVEDVGGAQVGAPKTPAIRLLVVPTENQAREAIIQATSGVPFDKIIREQSIGPERARGGYLGRVDPAILSSSVLAALATTRAGRLSPVFEMEGGFGVLQVLTDREERETEERLLRQPEALDLLARGTEIGKQGDVEGAVALLSRAVELDPGLADAQFNLGIGLWRLGRSEAAIRAMQEAARLQPDDYDAHMRLGAWLAVGARYGDAVAEYERATGLRIESPEAWLKLAQVYEAAGKSRAAVEAYRRVLGLLGRDDPLVLEALLKAALRAEDGPTAVDAARRLLARRSDHEGFLLLGDALLLSKQAEAAIQEYKKAVALAPNAARGHLRLATVYTQLNQPEPAAEQLLEAVRLEPNQPEYYQALSRLYEQMGRLDLAIVALRDGINAAASAAPALQAEMSDRLAILYERVGMSREAEAENRRAQTLRGR